MTWDGWGSEWEKLWIFNWKYSVFCFKKSLEFILQQNGVLTTFIGKEWRGYDDTDVFHYKLFRLYWNN